MIIINYNFNFKNKTEFVKATYKAHSINITSFLFIAIFFQKKIKIELLLLATKIKYVGCQQDKEMPKA